MSEASVLGWVGKRFAGYAPGQVRTAADSSVETPSPADDARRYRTPVFESEVLADIRAGNCFYHEDNLNRLITFDPRTRERVLDLLVDLVQFYARNRAELDDHLRARIKRILLAVEVLSSRTVAACKLDPETRLTFCQLYRRLEDLPTRLHYVCLIAEHPDPTRLDDLMGDLLEHHPHGLLVIAQTLAAERPSLLPRLERHLVAYYLQRSASFLGRLFAQGAAREIEHFAPLTQARILQALLSKGDTSARDDLGRKSAAFWRQVFDDPSTTAEEKQQWAKLMSVEARRELAADPLLMSRLSPNLLIEFCRDDPGCLFDTMHLCCPQQQFWSGCWGLLGNLGSAVTFEESRQYVAAFFAFLRKRAMRDIDLSLVHLALCVLTPAEQYELLALSREAPSRALLESVVTHLQKIGDLRFADFARPQSIVELFEALGPRGDLWPTACASLRELRRVAPHTYGRVIVDILARNPKLSSLLCDEAAAGAGANSAGPAEAPSSGSRARPRSEERERPRSEERESGHGARENHASAGAGPRIGVAPTGASPLGAMSPLEVCVFLAACGRSDLSETEAMAILGLSEGYDSADLMSAFRTRLLLVHPDRFAEHGHEVESIFKLAAQYTILAREVLVLRLKARRGARSVAL
jgi:hypothetical protein